MFGSAAARATLLGRGLQVPGTQHDTQYQRAAPLSCPCRVIAAATPAGTGWTAWSAWQPRSRTSSRTVRRAWSARHPRVRLPCRRDTTVGQRRAGRRSVRQAGSTGSCRVCIEAHLCSRLLPPGMAVGGCLGVAPLAGQVPAIPGCDGSSRQSTESLAPDPIPALPQSSTCTRAT